MRTLALLVGVVLMALGTLALAQSVTLNPDGTAPRGRRLLVNCDGGPDCTEASPEGLSCNAAGPGFSAGGCVATGFTVSAMPGQALQGGTAQYFFCDPTSDAGWAHNSSRDKSIPDGGNRAESFGPFYDAAAFNASRVHIRLANVVRNAGGDGGVVELTERCCLKSEGCP